MQLDNIFIIKDFQKLTETYSLSLVKINDSLEMRLKIEEYPKLKIDFNQIKDKGFVLTLSENNEKLNLNFYKGTITPKITLSYRLDFIKEKITTNSTEKEYYEQILSLYKTFIELKEEQSPQKIGQYFEYLHLGALPD